MCANSSIIKTAYILTRHLHTVCASEQIQKSAQFQAIFDGTEISAFNHIIIATTCI